MRNILRQVGRIGWAAVLLASLGMGSAVAEQSTGQVVPPRGAGTPTVTTENAEAGRPAGDQETDVAELRLLIFDQVGLPLEARRSMESEIEALFRGIGVAVDSVDGESVAAAPISSHGMVLRVIIWARDPGMWDMPPHTMGAYLSTDGRPQNVFLFQPGIAKELGMDGKPEGYFRPEEIGRAFGRVAAHEVVHAFATAATGDNHQHQGFGIMGQGLDAETLLQPQLRIDERSAAAFLRGLGEVGTTVAQSGS